MASSLGNKVLVHECVLAFEPDVRPSPTVEMQNRHNGKTHLCRALFFRAHDKGLICRGFFIERMVKKKRTANVLFAVRYKKTHDKDFVSRAIKKCTVKIFFAVRFLYSAHQSIFLPLGSPNKPNVIFYKILCHAL
jgi:hypothetical protein